MFKLYKNSNIHIFQEVELDLDTYCGYFCFQQIQSRFQCNVVDMAFASGSKTNICQTFCCIIIHSHEHLIKLIGTSCWICEDVTRNKNLFSPPPADGSLWGLTAEHVHLSPFSNLNWGARRSIYRFAFSLNP